MKKIRSSSWSNSRVKDKSYIASKRVDSSTFGSGTVIPNGIREEFLNNLSVALLKGQKHKVSLVWNGKTYEAKIDWVNNNPDRRKDDVIRIMFNDKRFIALLMGKLDTSYNYIKKYLSENNNKPPRKFPEETQEFIDFYKGDTLDTFIVKLIDRSQLSSEDQVEEDDDIDEESLEDIIEEIPIISEFNSVDVVTQIHSYISSKGFDYDESLIKNLYISLKAKPFVILSGISGTGKSKIVELFAEAIGATSDNKRFNLVPVKPDWSDATDLLGYRNIKGEFTPEVIVSVAYEAMMNPELPYFICLDEMNLARVEYYFSDVLSIMETRRLNEDGVIITNPLISKEQVGTDTTAFDKYGDVYLPENLFIVGTVNMDETTFPFSKKVLDRANTIEFNKVDLSYSFEERDTEDVEAKTYHNNLLKSEFLKLSHCIEHKETATKVINKLIEINDVLQEYNQHFGYRVRDEIVFYMIYATENALLEFDAAFDMAVMQKILPKISGSSQEVQDLLISLFDKLNGCKTQNSAYLEDADIKKMKENSIDKYKLTNEKIIYMIRRFIRDGFTTFWQ
ncbi:MAG: AAA family ATPase [Clostridium sp.]|uniref:McrB family protein n=1 Tax=Clostridium sp. TaxID=1506 RepID=UPI003073D6E9